VQSLVSKISRAQICLALTSGIARNVILYFFHITKQLHVIYVCSLYTVDYIGFTRTVGVVWVCRRFDHRPYTTIRGVDSVGVFGD